MLLVLCAASGSGLVVSASASAASPTTASAYAAAKLTVLACSTASTCEAVGTNSGTTLGIIFGTTDGGLAWERQSLPAVMSGIADIACPSASTCEAVGFTKSSSLALRTTNAGHTWVAQKLPAGASAAAIACPTVNVCEAVGGGALRTTNGGPCGRYKMYRRSHTTLPVLPVPG